MLKKRNNRFFTLFPSSQRCIEHRKIETFQSIFHFWSKSQIYKNSNKSQHNTSDKHSQSHTSKRFSFDLWRWCFGWCQTPIVNSSTAISSSVRAVVRWWIEFLTKCTSLIRTFTRILFIVAIILSTRPDGNFQRWSDSLPRGATLGDGLLRTDI
uniref:Candidate secreted effector n=1 Tax=Meloidogyne incognita TaxID=6306 RepID=A0A914MK35_MELIC